MKRLGLMVFCVCSLLSLANCGKKANVQAPADRPVTYPGFYPAS